MSTQPEACLNDLAVETMARGWCPGLARPMASGDGLLARIHPPLGALTPQQALVLAEAAHKEGNGLIDITSHGNLQIRGVRAETHAALRARLSPLGLDDAGLRAPYRATVLSPLAGLDEAELMNGRTLAGQVEAMARAVLLPPKFLITIETGGAFALDHLRPDLRVIATAADQLQVALAGAPLLASATMQAEQLLSALPHLLQTLSALLAETGARRVWHLTGNARRALLVLAVPGPAVPHSTAPEQATTSNSPPRAGLVALKNGRCALLAAAPFGQMSARALEGVARLAEDLGLDDIRLSPLRGFVLGGLETQQAPRAQARLAALGLITRPDDNRLRVLTCAGAPACGRARCNSHALASQIARHLAAPPPAGPAGDADIHLSACLKGCARRGPSALTLVAMDGDFAVIPGGGPLDAPAMRLPFAQILHRLSNLPAGRPLCAAF